MELIDPNMIHIDWERTFDALVLVIILAFIVERALAIIFENRMFIQYLDRSGTKELVAVAAAIGVCVIWKFDALGMILLTETTTIPGYVLTGLVVAGGSKASIKLFHDVFQIKSSAFDVRYNILAQKAATDAKNLAAAGLKTDVIADAESVLKKAESAVVRATEAAANSQSAVVKTSLQEAKDAEQALRKHVESLNPGTAGGS